MFVRSSLFASLVLSALGPTLAGCGAHPGDDLASEELSNDSAALGETGALSLIMDASELEKRVKDKAFKIYIDGKKPRASIATPPLELDIFVKNYTSGGSKRTYDVEVQYSVWCKGIGSARPPYEIWGAVRETLEPSELLRIAPGSCTTGFDPLRSSWISASWTQL